MIKVVGSEISDIIGTAEGAMFVRRSVSPDGSVRPAFYALDAGNKKIAVVTREAYLLAKFGQSFAEIAKQLPDSVTCTAVRFPEGHTFVIFPNGDTGLFGPDGSLLREGCVSYRGHPACGAAPDGLDVWCAVPEGDLIVKYSLSRDLVLMRVGGTPVTTFRHPVDITVFDGRLYVCNRDSCTVRTVNLSDCSVEDHLEFTEPVLRVICCAGHEIVVLTSGVYLL